MAFRNLSIDDRDPQLRYDDQWTRDGIYNATPGNESGTLAWTKSTRDTRVIFSFPQEARAFYYWGIPQSYGSGGWYAICFDCSQDNSAWEFIDALRSSANNESSPTILYSKKWDKPGFHEVALYNQPDDRAGGRSILTLDRYQIEIVEEPLTETVLSPTTITMPYSMPTGSSNSSGPIGAPAASLPPMNTGAIVGGTIAGVVILAVLVALAYILGRRHQRDLNSSHASTRALAPSTQSYLSTTSSTILPEVIQQEKQPGYIRWTSGWTRSSSETNAAWEPVTPSTISRGASTNNLRHSNSTRRGGNASNGSKEMFNEHFEGPRVL